MESRGRKIEQLQGKGAKGRKPLYGEDEWKAEREAERDADVPERDKSWGNLEDGSFSSCFWGSIGFVSKLAAD